MLFGEISPLNFDPDQSIYFLRFAHVYINSCEASVCEKIVVAKV